MADIITKIQFTFERDSQIVNSDAYSEKGNLTFTENAIYMGLGNGRCLKYPNFKSEDYYLKVQIDKLLLDKIDTTDVYTKEQLDAKLVDIKTKGLVDLSNYYNKQQIDRRLEEYVTINSDSKNVRYKGSVSKYSDLEQKQSKKFGDLYTVEDTKDNYVYDGDKWVKMMGIVDLSNYYTRAETEQSLSNKANTNEVYNKTSIDEKLELKSDKTEVESSLESKLDASKILEYYNKTEINEKLELKLDTADSMSKVELENNLNLKADKSDTYTKLKIDEFINSKANADNVYTKTEIVDLLATKPEASLTYTKLETNYEIENYEIPLLDIGQSYIANKVYKALENEELLYFIAKEEGTDFDGIITTNPNFMVICFRDILALKADKANTYTKDEVDNLIRNAIVEGKVNSDGSLSSVTTNSFYTKDEIDSLLKKKLDALLINNYYTKTIIDKKFKQLGVEKDPSDDVPTITEDDISSPPSSTDQSQSDQVHRPSISEDQDDETDMESPPVVEKPTTTLSISPDNATIESLGTSETTATTNATFIKCIDNNSDIATSQVSDKKIIFTAKEVDIQKEATFTIEAQVDGGEKVNKTFTLTVNPKTKQEREDVLEESDPEGAEKA